MSSEESKKQQDPDAVPCGDPMGADQATTLPRKTTPTDSLNVNQQTDEAAKPEPESGSYKDAKNSIFKDKSAQPNEIANQHDSATNNISSERQFEDKKRIEQMQQQKNTVLASQQLQHFSQHSQMQNPGVVQLAAPVINSFAKARSNLPQSGRNSTSNHPAANNLLNTVSQSNISINTSIHKRTDDEELDLNFTSDEEDKFNAAKELDHIDNCSNERFYKYKECISKSKYRTINRGYDNESGCEIAWTTYRLHNDQRERLVTALDQFKALGQSQESQNRNILRIFYNEVRKSATTTNEGKSKTQQPTSPTQEELVVVSELITAGSIREYLKKIYSSLRVNVIRIWCQKVLNALQFLHSHDIVHGELSCESVYINSNDGGIKVGDVGIKHIHTSDRTHELGASALYRKEKTSQKVDIFCFGLFLLEIVAASETGPSRQALKYIIRILKLGRKREMLATLKHDSMRDFVEKAIEEDPGKRYSVQQLLEHPFVTQVNKSQMKLSEGLASMIKEQVTHFKEQASRHQQSKTSNSLHLSVLNDSSQRRNTVNHDQLKVTTKTLVEQKKAPQNDIMKQDEESKEPTISAIHSSEKQIISQPAMIKAGSLPVVTRLRSPHVSDGSMTKQPPNDPSSPGIPLQLTMAQSHPNIRQKTGQQQRKVQHGKTMSYLELPGKGQKQQNGTPSKKLKKQIQVGQNHKNVQSRRRSGGSQAQQQRSKAGASSTRNRSGERRKISGTESPNQSSSNGRQKSGKAPSGGAVETQTDYNTVEEAKQQRRSGTSSNFAQIAAVSPLNHDLNEASSRNGTCQQDLQMSVTSPELTASENCLFFRIQIVMKGRKSDVKFPFDLQKDTPEAVAKELQDYFLHSEEDQIHLPDHAVRAVQLEIQKGIDCHYQSQSQQQMTTIEGRSQTQTQSSYQNKVLISMFEEQKDEAKEKKVPNQSSKPTRNERKRKQAEETKISAEQKLLVEQQVAAEVAKEAQRQLIEEAAQKREQEEVEQRLAHDYLSMVPLVDSAIYSRSLSLPSCPSPAETSSPEQTAASMQAEINQMLKNGQMNEQNFRNMQEQAIRKLSISQNSNEQQRRFLLACTGGNSPRMCEPQEIEEPETGNSAAVIEFEPQIPHNNTTGERHEKLIEEQQKNGPFGQQEILHYRNSQDCKDPDLINFMHNPDEEAKRNKDRRGKKENSAKSEAQESMWLLRELFPGYMEKYQEDYENNQVHMMPSHTLHISSQVDLSQYTIDLSFESLHEASHLSDSQKDLSQVPGQSEPFNVNISVILPERSQASSQVQQLSQAPIENTNQDDQIKPEVASGTQVAGDSSQQLQIPSDLDEGQHQKQIAQQRAVQKITNHRSFLMDCSESFVMALGNNMSGCFSHPVNLHKLNVKNQQLPANRPPSGQSVHTKLCVQELKRLKPLNNSHQVSTQQIVSFPHTVMQSNQMQSFHSHLDQEKQIKVAQNVLRTPHTGSITEMPAVDINVNPSSGSGGVTTTQEMLQRTQEAGRHASSSKTTFDVQLSSQISDSQISNKVTQFLPRVTKVQHAITYSRDSGQIQVISSSLENSTNQLQIGPVPEASLEQEAASQIINKKVQPAQARQKDQQEEILAIQKTTPSVMDICRSSSFPPMSVAGSDETLFGEQRKNQNSIKTLYSMDSFPNVVKNVVSEDDEKISEMESEEFSKNIVSNVEINCAAALKQNGIDASIGQQMRFKNNVSSVPTKTTVMTDLNQLFQIRQRGMHSERLEKGFKKMSVTDVKNLKFALKMLGVWPESNPKSEDNSLVMDKSSISNSEGHYDHSTRMVIRRLKKQEGLPVDAIVDHDTFSKIIDLAIQHLTRLKLESIQEQEEEPAQMAETREQVKRIEFHSSDEHDQPREISPKNDKKISGGDNSTKSGRSIVGRFVLHGQHEQDESPQIKMSFDPEQSESNQEQPDFSAKAIKIASRRKMFKNKKSSSMYEKATNQRGQAFNVEPISPNDATMNDKTPKFSAMSPEKRYDELEEAKEEKNSQYDYS